MPFGMRNVWHGERHAKLQNGKNAVFLPLWPDRGEESHASGPRKPVFQAFFVSPVTVFPFRPVRGYGPAPAPLSTIGLRL